MLPMRVTELDRSRALLAGYTDESVGRDPTSTEATKEQALPLSFRDLFYVAGELENKNRILSRLLVISIAIVGVAIVTHALWLLAALPLVIVVQWQSLRGIARKRVESFDRDYTAFLLSLASSVRTGRDPLQSLTSCMGLFPPESVLAQQIKALKGLLEGGMSEEDALRRFADSVAHPDLALFRTAYILARREGSSLGECLYRLARVTRNRQSFRRRTRAAVAMQKLSAYGITICTLIVCLFQFVMNSEGLFHAAGHPVGILLLSGGAGLIVVGLVWMRLITGAEI